MNIGGGHKTASVAYATLFSRCPRCGRGPLFTGFLTVASSCNVCGLGFARFEAGDGPAVFAILIVGAVVGAGALFMEAEFHPPYWVQGVIWGPAVIVLSLGLLRPLKAGLIALQYKHNAEEGRLAH
jgi:uncharacterized protein (DUF983 family)